MILNFTLAIFPSHTHPTTLTKVEEQDGPDGKSQSFQVALRLRTPLETNHQKVAKHQRTHLVQNRQEVWLQYCYQNELVSVHVQKKKKKSHKALISRMCDSPRVEYFFLADDFPPA